MKALPDHIKEIFYKFLREDISIAEFEQWINSVGDLEKALGAEDYLELISINFKKTDAGYEIKKLLFTYIDKSEFATINLMALLKRVISHEHELPELLVSFYNLYCDGYYFLQNLALRYAISVIVPPTHFSSDNWDKLKSAEKKEVLDKISTGATEAVKLIIKILENKKIILTGTKNTEGKLDFIDNRNNEEKRLTSYQEPF